ncbi:MBL fold metallo-hydrolase [Paenibacillus sp. GCM10027626]|uniref:MBL fold metallo-hydrolase n=1 Tax=Paenibacillus sp. GCM10027626 TaxID=3273411 RepID=UPI00363DF5A6
MRYENMDPAARVKSYADIRRWRRERANRMRSKDFSWIVPSAAPELDYLHRNDKEPTVTWIGHSTFLLQHSGLNIVTDPVWARRMALQKRLSSPGIALADMPPIDIVLLSHSHYDHLHMQSLKRLGGKPAIVVPAGLAAKLRRKGFPSVIELGWWQSAVIGAVKITFVPAQHWTRRTLTDTNRSHWGGYILEPAQKQDEAMQPTMYFAGDSGYFNGFKMIGERFDIDIALMPIGAYEPEWFMGPQHVTPEEALQAFADVGAKLFVPMHYGAFRLADDTPREALDRLEAERQRLGLAAERICVLPLGETLRLQPSGTTNIDEDGGQ